jgi:uncharacterized protein (TIGR03545 family)
MNQKIQKKKGPIRIEAILPVAVITGVTFLYFSYYFDRHLKSLFEYVGTQANGAEVNVASVHTSFLKASFKLNGLEVTDKERPTHNSLEIESIHFQYLWDALLRMKFVVEDASINNIQIAKPRKKPGFVIPPAPAKPSKLDELQLQIMSQVKTQYSKNVLGDVISLLEGGDYKDQLEKIRDDLKSEARVKTMLADVKSKKEFWDERIKTLSDTKKLKTIEDEINQISKQKNFLEQAKGVQKLGDLLKEVDKQYKEIQSATKQLQGEVQQVASYPRELEALVKEDIDSLKNRFSIPEIDFKDMAMHLFAGQFAGHLVKARQYQALAQQYLPEKKEAEEVVPPKRAEGKSYDFPITKGYPLFWLKRAAISSKGTADSYSGNVSGELTNVTTSPKVIKKPVVLDIQGDFPATQVMGVKALITADFTRDVSKQTALLEVKSFPVSERLFVDESNLRFGFTNATGSSTITASLQQDLIQMSWNSTLNNPKFLIESKTKIAQEMISNILNSIPAVTINGSATGTFKDLKLKISSNLGDELAGGLKREVAAKISEAQSKINELVESKINQPKAELMSALGSNKLALNDLGNIADLYKKNEDRIKIEIEKLKKGGTKDLKEQGKKLLKGLKF